MKYFTADLHFGHKNILRYDTRPWTDLDTMKSDMIANINKTVGIHDELYILGDISLHMKPAKMIEIIDQIKCKNLILIRGNHDEINDALKEKFLRVEHYMLIRHTLDNGMEKYAVRFNANKKNQIKLILMHYPIIAWNGKETGSIHLHGHVHKGYGHEDFFHPRKINVGCMLWDYRPVSIDEILQYIIDQERNMEKYNTRKLTINDIGFVSEIRQRLGLEPEDNSKDDYILQLQPFDRVKLIVGWYIGHDNWGNTFKSFCESQGIYLTTNQNNEGVIK